MITVREPATDADIGVVISRNPAQTTPPVKLDLSHSCAIVDSDGSVLGCCGIAPLFEETGEVWSIFSEKLFDQYALSVTRGAKPMLKKWQSAGEFGRITAITPVSHTHSGWLEALGFEVEGVMRNFGPGAQGDWCIMGLFRN
jgi:hypothetical protein